MLPHAINFLFVYRASRFSAPTTVLRPVCSCRCGAILLGKNELKKTKKKQQRYEIQRNLVSLLGHDCLLLSLSEQLFVFNLYAHLTHYALRAWENRGHIPVGILSWNSDLWGILDRCLIPYESTLWVTRNVSHLVCYCGHAEFSLICSKWWDLCLTYTRQWCRSKQQVCHKCGGCNFSVLMWSVESFTNWFMFSWVIYWLMWVSHNRYHNVAVD